MSVKIKYVLDVKPWTRMSDLREGIFKARAKGGPLLIRGNLSQACQAALLKIMEEFPDVEITTSHRLSATLESRAEVEGSLEMSRIVDPNLMGLYVVAPRTAEAVTTLQRMMK